MADTWGTLDAEATPMTDKIEDVKILSVEDNPNDAELCIRALKKSSFANEQIWVRDGAEAIDLVFATGAFAGRPVSVGLRLILLDLQLPTGDGPEVLQWLKSDDRLKEFPVAVLTSSRERRDLSQSYQLGVNSYISKPVAFDEFAETISLLGLHRLLISRIPNANP